LVLPWRLAPRLPSTSSFNGPQFAVGAPPLMIVPLALEPSIVSALTAGLIGSGRPTGGVQGGVGEYTSQHAHTGMRYRE
jgi:hypothetical protein